jgi:hypothetical protein
MYRVQVFADGRVALQRERNVWSTGARGSAGIGARADPRDRRAASRRPTARTSTGAQDAADTTPIFP